jgi:hypothetical protein
MMKSMSSALLGAALIVGGCCPPKKADTTTTVVTPPAPDAGPTVAPPAPTPYEAAQAEVTRLVAIADAHPLLAAWTGPYGGVPPWDRLDVGQVATAYAAALPLYEAEAALVAANPEAPTFANTLVPLENAGRHLDRLDALFGVMTSNLSTPAVQAVDKEWSPRVAATYDRITFNAALFQRIAAVYAARATLTPEQARLVTRRYQEAVRSGAQLAAADQAKLGAINEQLAGAFAEFSARVLADEDTWIVLDDEAQLAGLSPSQIAAYGGRRGAQAGRQVGRRQHPLERRSVPDGVGAPRPARAGVGGVQGPRRSRRRPRHQGADQGHRPAARRARQAARLRRPTRTGGWPTRWRSIRPRPTS